MTFLALPQMVPRQPLLPLLSLKAKNRVIWDKGFYSQAAKQLVPFLIAHSHLDLIFNT